MTDQDADRSIDERVADLLGRMTIEEKCAQLGGAWFSRLIEDGELSARRLERRTGLGIGHITRIAAESGEGPERTSAWANGIQRFLTTKTRLGIPAIIHEEAVAGLCGHGAAQFPQAIGLASTWDPDLVAEVAASAGRHLRAVGARLALAPVLDIARDPRWGRLEETYGEDPHLASRMGVAYVNALQAEGVVAAAKHFLGYGGPDAGFNHGEMSVGPRRLRDVIAAPFRAAINEAGLGSVMNAYNEIDGLPCGGTAEILTDLLRDELGFTGTVVADYFAVSLLMSYHHVAADKAEAATLALVAGLDVELPAYDCYRELPGLVASGAVDEAVVDRAVRRVLREKFTLGLFENPYVDEAAAPAAFDTGADRELARRAAARSMVLLTNDGILPLDLTQLSRVAVIGPTADDPRLLLGDYHWPAHVEFMVESGVSGMPGAADGGTVRLEQVATTTPLDGLRRALEPAGVEVTSTSGCDITGVDTTGVGAAVADARAADVAVVCVGGRSGLTMASTSGEFRDVSDLGLPGVQSDLVAAVAGTGTPTVMVVISGRAHALEAECGAVGAAVVAWLPGEEGGAGLADVLTGAVNPAGRLPVSLLRTAGQVGVHSGHHRGGGRSQFLGAYVDGSNEPAFAFGHGGSYTTFEYDDLEVGAGSTTHDVTVAVTVRNTGARHGDEVVQVYVRDEVASVGAPERRLVAFARVPIDAGGSVRLRFTIPAGRLGFFGADLRFRVEPGAMTFMVGASRVDIRLRATITLAGAIAFPDPNTLDPARYEVLT